MKPIRALAAAAVLCLASGSVYAQTLGDPPAGGGTLGSGTGTGTLGDTPTGSGTIGTPPGGGGSLGAGLSAPRPIRPTAAPRGGGGVPLSELDDSTEVSEPDLATCLTQLPRPIACLWL